MNAQVHSGLSEISIQLYFWFFWAVCGQFALWHWHAQSLSRSTERLRPPCTHLTLQGHPDTAILSAGHTVQTGHSLPSPGKLRPQSFWTDWNKALIKMPPDTRLIREESYLNLQHHLKSDGKSSTPKSCKDATDSPSLFPSPKIHQHLDRTSGFLLRRAASRHRNLVRTAAHKRVSCPHHNTQQKLWHPTSTQA